MENKYSHRPLKQPKIDFNEDSINPILKKLIENMNKEGFMIEEDDILKRLEEYKKKKRLS
jgi:hypothetical protein